MRRLAGWLTGWLLLVGATVTAGPAPALGASTAPGARFVAVRPVRIVDSRNGQGVDFALLQAGQDTPLDVLPGHVAGQLAGQLGVPAADVVAIVANITLTRTERAGHLTLWAFGQPRPGVAHLNAPGRLATVSNLATVPVGDGGRVAAFTNTGGELIVDLQGAYVIDADRRADPGATVRAGRLVPYVPTRVLDTRQLGTPLEPRQRATLSLARSIPPDAIAVVLDVTATNTRRAGFVTVFAGSGSPPPVAHLSVDAPGQTRTNQVITAVQAQRLDVFSSAGGDVVVDLLGYYTGERAPASTHGLFHVVPPTRVTDTRGGPQPGEHSVTRVDLDAVAATGATASAVAGHVVAVDPAGGATVGNHSTLLLGADGAVDVYARQAAHLVVEVYGYFAGRPGKRLLPDARVPAASRWQLGPVVPAEPTPPPVTNFTNGVGSDGKPVERWDPCRPIELKVNFGAATPEQVEMFSLALTKVVGASGLPIVLSGGFAHTLRPDGASDVGADLAVQVVGTDDPVWVEQTAGVASGGFTYAMSTVVGSRYWFDDVVVTIPDNLPLMTTLHVFMHELGHAVGLQHVPARTEVMYPRGHHASPIEWGPGDLAGLAAVGAAAGCR